MNSLGLSPKRAESGVGWRYHVSGPQCWCGVKTETVIDPCGCWHVMYVHRNVMLNRDSQPRLTIWSQ
jgi:hypothetical protein